MSDEMEIPGVTIDRSGGSVSFTSAPKLTAEEAFRRAAISDPEDAAIALSELASLGYKLVDKDALVIPTDPASVDDMVERGAMAMAFERGHTYKMRETTRDDLLYLFGDQIFYEARAVLTAAIPGLGK